MSSKPSEGSFGKDEIDSAKQDLDKFSKDVSELGMKHKQFWEETRYLSLVNSSTGNNSKYLNKFVLLQTGISASSDSQGKLNFLPITGGTLGYINNANIFRVIQNPNAELKDRGVATSTKLIEFLEGKNMVITIPNELKIKEFKWLSENQSSIKQQVYPVFSGSPPASASMPQPGPLFFFANKPITYDKAKQYLMYNGVMPGEYNNDITRVNQLNKNVFLDGNDGAASNIFITKPTVVPDSMVLFEKDSLMPNNICGSVESMGIDGSSWEQADGSEYKELEILNNWDFDSCKSFAESRGSNEFALGAGEDWKLVVIHNPSSQQKVHGTNLSGEYHCGSKTMKAELLVRQNIGNNDHVGSKFMWTGQVNPTDPSIAVEIETQMKEALSKLGISMGSSIDVEKTYIAWPVFFQGEDTRYYLFHDNSSSPPSWRMGADFCDAPNTLYFNDDVGGVVTTGCVNAISSTGVVNNKPKIEGGQTTVDDPSKYTAHNVLAGCGPGTESDIYSAEKCRFGGQQLETPMTTMKTIDDAGKPSGCYVEGDQLFFNTSGIRPQGEKPGFVDGKSNPLPKTGGPGTCIASRATSASTAWRVAGCAGLNEANCKETSSQWCKWNDNQKQYGLCYSQDGEKPKDVEGFANQYPPYNFSKFSSSAPQLAEILAKIPRGSEFIGRDIYCPNCKKSRTSGCGLGKDSCVSSKLPNAANGTNYGLSNPHSSRTDIGWDVTPDGQIKAAYIGGEGRPEYGKKYTYRTVQDRDTYNYNYTMLSKRYGGFSGHFPQSVNGGSLLSGGGSRCPYIYSSLGAAKNACNNNASCKYIQKQGNLCGGNYEIRGAGRVSIDNPWGVWRNFRMYEKNRQTVHHSHVERDVNLAREYIDTNGFSISPDGSISNTGWKFCPVGTVNVNPNADPENWWNRCLSLETDNPLPNKDIKKAAQAPTGGVFETFDGDMNKVAPWATKPLEAPGCVIKIVQFDKPGYFINDLVKVTDFSPSEIEKYNIFEYELEYYDTNGQLKKEKVGVSTIPNCLDGIHNVPRNKPDWNTFRGMLTKSGAPMITEAKYNSPAYDWKTSYSQMENLLDTGITVGGKCVPNRTDLCTDPNYKFYSPGPKVCYNEKRFADAGGGPCGSWCRIKGTTSGSGCNPVKICGTERTDSCYQAQSKEACGDTSRNGWLCKWQEEVSHGADCGNKTTPEKMIQTFNETGCPNPDKKNAGGWWATQSKATVLADMYNWCDLTNKGKRGKNLCCGNDPNCGIGKLKCNKQRDWAGCHHGFQKPKPRGSCREDYMNYFGSQKEWYRALVDLPKLQGGFFITATVEGTSDVPVAFVYTKKMKDTGPTYNNFVEYGKFKPYYKMCDPINTNVRLGVTSYKEAKKKVVDNLPPEKKAAYLEGGALKEGLVSGWNKTPEANILQTLTKPGQGQIVTYTVKTKILYLKPDDVPVGSYEAKEGGSLSVLLPNTCWYVKKGVTSGKKNPNPYVIADAPFMSGCSNTTLFSSTGSGVTLTRNGYLCSASGSQEYVCDTVKGALISYIATEINNSGLDPRCKTLGQMKIDVNSIKISGFSTESSVMGTLDVELRKLVQQMAGIAINYPSRSNLRPDSETGSVTLDINKIKNQIRYKIPALWSNPSFNYIFNSSKVMITYKKCGNSTKNVTQAFKLSDGSIELECELYKICDMRLYITDTGQLKLYKRPSDGWQDSGNDEGGGSGSVIWATDPIQEIQDAPVIPKWREKRNYIETGRNNFLGIGDFITSNNGRFRFYIKKVNEDPKSLWQQLLVSYGLIGKLKDLSVSGCRGYTTNVTAQTKCIGVIQYSVIACGDKAGGIMSYDFKSNKYEIKPSNTTIGSKYSNVAGYVSSYTNSYANNNHLYDTFYIDEFNQSYYISPDNVDFSQGRYVYIGRYGIGGKPFNIMTIPTSEITSKERIEKWINQTIRNKGITKQVQAYTLDLLKRTVNLYDKGFAPSKKNSDLVKLYPPQVLKDASSLLYVRVSPIKDSTANCSTMVIPGTISDVTEQIGGSGGSGQPAKCTFARNTDDMRQKMFDDVKKLRNTAGRNMQNNINSLQSTQDLLINKLINQKNRFGEDSENYHQYLKIMEDIEKDHLSGAMRTDSDLKLVHQNYRYIVWGIVAISIMLGILAIRRK